MPAFAERSHFSHRSRFSPEHHGADVARNEALAGLANPVMVRTEVIVEE